jgi:SNF2 family DNA or RNA helicase
MATLINILNLDVSKEIQPMLSLSSAPQFREAVAPVYYRRKREDVLTELPELVESMEWCNLQPEEKKVYQDALSESNFMAARRVSWNVDDLSKSSKAQRMLEIIEEARAEERKVLIFSFFLDTVAKVAALLGESCMEPITGSVSPQRRQEIIDEFDKAPAGSALVAQIQSGGTGLNIQSASVVILCEPQLKPSIENQAISRAYRMGQARSVLVYRLLCDDTVDERIIDILAQKQEEFDAFWIIREKMSGIIL